MFLRCDYITCWICVLYIKYNSNLNFIIWLSTPVMECADDKIPVVTNATVTKEALSCGGKVKEFKQQILKWW